MRVKNLLSTLAARQEAGSAPAGPPRQESGAPATAKAKVRTPGSLSCHGVSSLGESAVVLPSGAWLERCSGGHRVSRGN